MNSRQSSPEPHQRDGGDPLETGDGLKLKLTRHPGDRSARDTRPVLLLHGASASSGTFLVPTKRHLVGYLQEKGCDVWTLDWRSSWRVVESHAKEPKHFQKFTLDGAARQDLPLALKRIHQSLEVKRPIAVFGHCMGAGALAMAIGAGTIPEGLIDCAIFSTLGLFYNSSWDGWIKAEDRLLEKIRGKNPDCFFIDSDAEAQPWPLDMDRPYGRWPRVLLPDEPPKIFRRLAFMFGRPYREKITPPEIHRDSELRKQFGPMALKLYMHCAQNVRRGFAAEFDAMDWTPDGRVREASKKSLGPIAATYLNAAHFRGLKVTLITGEHNQLWHPDSIHRMYDWLRRELGELNCRRRIFRSYAHQDLIWGKHAREQVYPTIASALGL